MTPKEVPLCPPATIFQSVVLPYVSEPTRIFATDGYVTRTARRLEGEYRGEVGDVGGFDKWEVFPPLHFYKWILSGLHYFVSTAQCRCRRKPRTCFNIGIRISTDMFSYELKLNLVAAITVGRHVES
jgi:hypothetical protein